MFFALLATILTVATPPGPAEVHPHGLEARPEAKPFLNLPRDEGGVPPALLSQTGAFADVRSLAPVQALLPYDLILPFWSDGAEKARWISVPTGKTIRPAADGEWVFPEGTVFIKHFEIGTDRTRPVSRRRLETRFLIRDTKGGVFGVSYRWRPDQSDADLVRAGQFEPLSIKTSSGVRALDWYYPGPADCRQCHTAVSGGILGVKPRQLNREVNDPAIRATDNQLSHWSHLGLLEPPLDDVKISRLPRLGAIDDPARTVEDRARSYLDVNCAQCHRPGGAAADFDARYTTPLPRQRLIGEQVRINLAIEGARAIAPNDAWRSAILTRMSTLEPTRMPPLAHQAVDRRGVDLIGRWIASLPGPPVMAPPVIRPGSGDYKGPVRVILDHPNPSATLRYTLDGSAPGTQSPAYAGPFELRGSATVRARAYRPGATRSIVVQETFILDD